MGQRLWQSGFHLLAAAAMATWLLLASVSLAQEAAPAFAAEQPAAKPAAYKPLPSEVEPPVYYLPDKDGKLQLVLGFALEEFNELFKLKNRLALQNRRPSFSIENLTLSGSADRQRVEFDAQYSVTVHEAGWVGVPLRLNDAVLLELAGYEGPGEHFPHFEPQGHGYVIWIRSEAETTHQIKLKLLSPVTHIGSETHLHLSLPRDVALSQLRLQVPLPRAVAKVSEGGILESTRELGEKTELKVVGLGGELDVAWHAAEAQVAGLPTVLEATGAVQIHINGRNVSSDAKLTVRSLGGEFDRFQVRLPPGAECTDAAQAGISLVAVDAAAAKGKLYEVKLEKKTTGPVEIRLVTERLHNAPQAGEALELAGFEVLGAVRQWGTIAVQVEGNWQVQWGHTNQGQVDELSGRLRPDDRTAAFEYFVQPYSLTARIVPQKTRVRVEPEYVLLVGSHEAQLRAKLKYTVRGAKVRTLDVDLGGWEVDSVGPDTLVDGDALALSQRTPFTIPLLQASSGEMELTLEAHQKIAPDAARIALELPHPQGEVIANANVAVVPSDNIELVLQPEETKSLAPQAIRPQIKLPDRQQDPLYFRTEGSDARFVASLKVHEQSISATMSTQLDVDERQTRIAERIVFQITYQPTDHLTLGIPRSLRADRLKITLDGQRLLPAVLRERPDSEAEVIPMRVALPAPRIGRCELEVSYVTPHEKPVGTASTTVKIPLVIPGEGQLTTNELVVLPKAGISARCAKDSKGAWTDDVRNRPAANGAELALSARRAIAEVALALSSTERQAASATTIQRAWIQTQLTEAQRQDRAVYLLTTSEPRLQIALPPEADMGSLELTIDSRRVTPDSVHQRDVTVTLPTPAHSEYLLQLDYHFASRPPAGQLALECPQIKSAQWVQQLYWQLVLPATEHLLVAPDDFTREFRWVWSSFHWNRRPSLGQRELESWIGALPGGDSGRPTRETPEQYAARQQAGINSTNQYLFSTVGTVEPLAVYTLSRARLVLGASLPLLVGGLLLIYFPAARHPGVLLGLALLLAAGSFFDPELALLLAQASSLGLALALMAALLARASARPAVVSSTVPMHGSSQSLVERSATEMYQRAPSAGLQPSTSTEPFMPAVSSEAES